MEIKWQKQCVSLHHCICTKMYQMSALSTFKSLKLMDQVKRASDDALDQIQSNGFHLDQPDRTLKSLENCAKQARSFVFSF